MKTVYQPICFGQLKYFNSSGEIVSKQVFTTKESAEKYLPEFIKLCTEDDGDKVTSLKSLNPEFVETQIVELIIND